MKTIVPIVTLTAVLLLSEGLASRAEDSEDPAIQAAVQKALAEAQKAGAEVRQEYEKARQQFEQLAAKIAEEAPKSLNQLQTSVRRALGGSGKTLVIRSAEVDAKAQASLEEDLAVMSHLLERTLDEKLGETQRSRTAMGIEVFFGPGGSTVRSLYLDGYGALFLLNVNFPVLSP